MKAELIEEGGGLRIDNESRSDKGCMYLKN